MRKRARNKGGFGVSSISSQMMQQLNGEVSGVLQDGGKSAWEKKQWMKKKVVQLEEQQVSYQMQAFEMEKQRLKWDSELCISRDSRERKVQVPESFERFCCVKICRD